MNTGRSTGHDFSGHRVLVTGASRGIGLGVAEAFAAAGAELTLLAASPAIHTAAAELASRHGREVAALQCDISDSAAVRAAAATLDRVDVLVNNAGLEQLTPLLAEDDEVERTFRRILDINVLGTFLVSRHVVPKMPAGSSMIVTCSIWSRTAVAEFSAYCASKHANLGLVRSLARELGPRGIRVNGVCPGWVRTEAAMRSLAHMSVRSGRSEDDLLAEIVGAQILDGLMEPADVAGSYLFLASDAAASITGQTLQVDRGEVMA